VTVTTPMQGTVSNQMINHHMANQCTKFEVSSFSHSGDILGGTENVNGSRDHNHAPFRDRWAGTVKLCTKFEIFTYTH